MQSFTDFKKSFYEKVEDLSLFDCGEVNLLKTVLDGLKVNYLQKGKIRTFLFYPWIFCFAVIYFKALRKRGLKSLEHDFNFKSHQHKKILISDVGRVQIDTAGQSKSYYFENLINYFNEEEIFHIVDADSSIKCDSIAQNLKPSLLTARAYLNHRALRRDVLLTFKKIKRAQIFNKTEIANIKVALFLFLEQYILWYEILSLLPEIKQCYFVCHYHKEGQIFALKKKGVSCIELQHGLIARQDIFYVFPERIRPLKNRLLFADKIFVYGPYWKTVLMGGYEYDESQIVVLGDYPYNVQNASEVELLRRTFAGKKIVLITTQTYLHDQFISFIETLIEQEEVKSQNIQILVKPHPSENIGLYQDRFSPSKKVLTTQKALSILFQIADIHISIYSTSLYDALRYGVKNYVFKVKGYEDYVQEIVENGIAEEIKNFGEFANKMFENKGVAINPEVFYAQFAPELLETL